VVSACAHLTEMNESLSHIDEDDGEWNGCTK
jgi:hypothetical protein